MKKLSKNHKMKNDMPTVIKVNPKIYPLDVIYSAAYVFLDGFYIILDGDPQKEVLVSISPKNGSEEKDIEKKFHNELLNYAFYKKQTDKNAEIRKAIIQRALITGELSGESATKKLTSEKEDGIEVFEDSDIDFIEDPEGIAIPWEEKFGKKAKGRRGKGGKQ